MTKLSTPQLAQLKLDYVGYMSDLCTIQIRSDAQATDGELVPTFANTYTNVPCMFEFSPFKFRAREMADLGMETSEILVRCRLSTTYLSIVSQNDRIVLTSRYGTTLTESETYEIQGFAEHSASGLILNLRRVEA